MMISIIVTVHQTEHQIAEVIDAILNYTISQFELIVVYDGCTDRSEQIVNGVLERNKNRNWTYRALHTPDVNETLANNAGMQAAVGDFLILVQDDMRVHEVGWETRLLKPILKWPDVFAVSAKNAHSYSQKSTIDQVVYRNRFDATNKRSRNTFAIRDSVNRGPLAMEAETVRSLDYLDSCFAPLHRDDADLCMRAYLQMQKICGAYSIKWTNLQSTRGSHSDSILSNNMRFSDVISRNWKTFYNRYNQYFGHDHDENRRLE